MQERYRRYRLTQRTADEQLEGYEAGFTNGKELAADAYHDRDAETFRTRGKQLGAIAAMNRQQVNAYLFDFNEPLEETFAKVMIDMLWFDFPDWIDGKTPTQHFTRAYLLGFAKGFMASKYTKRRLSRARQSA